MRAGVAQAGTDFGVLREKTIMGIGWSTATQLGKQVLKFVITVILARVLTPQDFGLVGMIVVFTGFAVQIVELGFSAALIQREGVEEQHYSSVFWLNVLAGLLMTSFVMLAASAIATFYSEPKLQPLTMFIALTFLINSLNLVQHAILRRKMEFHSLALIEIITLLVAGIVAILMAMVGYGVWSLVWQMLVTASLTTVLLWWRTRWHPRLLLRRTVVVELLRFSTNLAAFKAVNYWVRNGNNMVIGKFIGSTELGIYTRAYTTMLLPLHHVTRVLTKVMFPAMSRVQNDKPRVKRIYLRCVSMIALITFPMMMGLLVVADRFVLGLFGPKWAEAIPIVRILSLVGMLQSIASTDGWIYLSQGRTDRRFRWSLVAWSVLIVGIAAGIFIGTLEALAASYALAEFVLLYPSVTIAGKLINMTFNDLAQTVSGTFACAAAMASLVFGVGFVLPESWSHWASLVFQLSIGVIAYALLIHLFQVKPYQDARRLFREQWRLKRRRWGLATQEAMG